MVCLGEDVTWNKIHFTRNIPHILHIVYDDNKGRLEWRHSKVLCLYAPLHSCSFRWYYRVDHIIIRFLSSMHKLTEEVIKITFLIIFNLMKCMLFLSGLFMDSVNCKLLCGLCSLSVQRERNL